MQVQYTYIHLTIDIVHLWEQRVQESKSDHIFFSRGVSTVCVLLLTDYNYATGFILYIYGVIGLVVVLAIT
jgi:hypothetical protein